MEARLPGRVAIETVDFACLDFKRQDLALQGVIKITGAHLFYKYTRHKKGKARPVNDFIRVVSEPDQDKHLERVSEVAAQ